MVYSVSKTSNIFVLSKIRIRQFRTPGVNGGSSLTSFKHTGKIKICTKFKEVSICDVMQTNYTGYCILFLLWGYMCDTNHENMSMTLCCHLSYEISKHNLYGLSLKLRHLGLSRRLYVSKARRQRRECEKWAKRENKPLRKLMF